jgi:hypothetical protein
MAATHVIEQSHLRTGSADWQSYGDSVRVFGVATSVATDDDSVVLFAEDPHTHLTIPEILSPHPTRALMFCSNKSCRQVDDKAGRKWEVVCTYGLISNILPWNQPVTYNWSQQSSEHIVDRTLDSTPVDIKNSAGRPFDPAITATRYEAVLQAVRNETEFDATTPLKYVGAVNSDTFKGASPGFCMCVGISASQQIYTSGVGAQTTYWQVTYNFAFRNQYSYQPIVLDAGLSQISRSSGKLVNILDGQGREVSSPWPLDGEGHALPVEDDDTPADFHFFQFKIYPAVAFGDLGL